jgi:hypothetical protein
LNNQYRPYSTQAQEATIQEQDLYSLTYKHGSQTHPPFIHKRPYEALLAYYGKPIGSILPPSVISEAHSEVNRRMKNITEKQTITINSSAFEDAQSPAARRRVIRKHLDAAVTSRDIFRVVAAALQRPCVAAELPQLSQQIIHAFFRSRRTSSDLTIALKIMVLINRFDKAGLRVSSLLLTEGLKFAIRSRNLRLAKRFLQEIRFREERMSRKVFRSTIAKCGIGPSRMGEIRNGAWNRAELLQVVLGFSNAKPGQEYHLGSFLDRSDWRFMSGWLLILSWCGAKDQLLKEWVWWTSCSQQRFGQKADDRPPQLFRRSPADIDRWFILQFVRAGDPARAWQILKERQIDPFSLNRDLLHALLERADLATFWTERLSRALAEKFKHDLERVERLLGIQFIERHGFKRLAPVDVLSTAMKESLDRDIFKRNVWITGNDYTWDALEFKTSGVDRRTTEIS